MLATKTCTPLVVTLAFSSYSSGTEPVEAGLGVAGDDVGLQVAEGTTAGESVSMPKTAQSKPAAIVLYAWTVALCSSVQSTVGSKVPWQ